MVITGYDSVFLCVQLVSILRDRIVQANFVQFDDDFMGLGAVVGMLLQWTFKSFSHSVSIQAWVKCLKLLNVHWRSIPTTAPRPIKSSSN